MRLQAGEILQERYEIISMIGEGASAEVYKVWDDRLESFWALKVFSYSDRQSAGKDVQRFYAEADLLKRLQHPAIPKIIDIFECTFDQSLVSGKEDDCFDRQQVFRERNLTGNEERLTGKCPVGAEKAESEEITAGRQCGYEICLVMDLLQGMSLENILRQRQSYSVGDILDWGIQLCDILSYLHGQSPPLIYRDMKPGHVIVGSDGQLHLLDLGIVRSYTAGKEADTEALGTRGYAAPEQYGSGQTDCRTDIFGLGMTLWELLEKCPQKSEAEEETHKSKVRGRELRQYGGERIAAKEEKACHKNYLQNDEKKKNLRRILCKCTEPNPKKRYQSCRTLKAALQSCRGEKAWKLHILKFHELKYHKSYVLAGILVLFFICFLGNILFQGTSTFMKRRSYCQLIRFSGSESTEEKMKKCEEAILLQPEDLQAYQTLLSVFEEKGLFGAAESAEITALIEENREVLQKEEGFDDLLFRVGQMYIYLFKDEEQDLQERLQLAYPWFAEVREKYAEAESFAGLAEYVRDYVFTGMKEEQPDEAAYRALLKDLESFAEEEWPQETNAYGRLLTAQEISRLLYSQSAGMQLCAIDPVEEITLLQTIFRKVEGEAVTREDCLSLQQETLEEIKGFIAELQKI